MASIYSTLFVEANAVNVLAEYDVPDGFVAVIRDICMLLYGSPSDTAAYVFNGTDTGVVTYALHTDPFQAVHWEGRQVFPTGSRIIAQAQGPAQVSLRVSGYLLAAP